MPTFEKLAENYLEASGWQKADGVVPDRPTALMWIDPIDIEGYKPPLRFRAEAFFQQLKRDYERDGTIGEALKLILERWYG